MLRVSHATARYELSEVLDEIVRAPRTVLPGVSAAGISLVATNASGIRLAAASGLSPGYRRALEESPDLLENGATAKAIRTNEPVWVADTHTDPLASRVRDLATREGLRSFLAIPLSTESAVMGALAVYRNGDGCWSSEEIKLLQFFAEHAAAAVQTTQLITQKEEQLAGMQHLVHALRAQGHEHANRLHALHGMLALGQPEEAKQFLAEIVSSHSALRSELSARIGVPALAGLLLAQAGIAAQREIDLQIDRRTRLAASTPNVSELRLITLVANLLNNAFDAVELMGSDRRVVRLHISDRHGKLVVSVRDYGPGLPDSLEKLAAPGMTTKTAHSGEGLALVLAMATITMGSVDAVDHRDGTTITVTIPLAATPAV